MLSFNEIMKQAVAQQQRAKDEISHLRAKKQEIDAQKKRELVQMHRPSSSSKPVNPVVKNKNKEPPSLSEALKTFKIPKKIDPDASRQSTEGPARPSISKNTSRHETAKPSTKDAFLPNSLSMKSRNQEKDVCPDKKVKKTTDISVIQKTENKPKKNNESEELRKKIQKDIQKKTESVKPSSTPAVSCFDNDLLSLLNEAKYTPKPPPPKIPPPKPTVSRPVVVPVPPKKPESFKTSSIEVKKKNPPDLKSKKVAHDVTMAKKRPSSTFMEQPSQKKPASFEEMMKLASENAKKLQSGERPVPSTSQVDQSKSIKTTSSSDSRSRPDYQKFSNAESKKNSTVIPKPQMSRPSGFSRPISISSGFSKKNEPIIVSKKSNEPIQKNLSQKSSTPKYPLDQKKPSQMEIKKHPDQKKIQKPYSKPPVRNEYPSSRYPPNPYMDRERYDDDEYDSLDDFIDDDVEDDRPAGYELSKVLKKFCRSDKNTWMRREREIDISKMQANYRTIEAEDRQSARIARMEDMLEEQKGARRLQ